MHCPFDEPNSSPIPEFEIDFKRADVAMKELRGLIWEEAVKSHPELQGDKKWIALNGCAAVSRFRPSAALHYRTLPRAASRSPLAP
jgi:hypothetical protein